MGQKLLTLEAMGRRLEDMVKEIQSPCLESNTPGRLRIESMTGSGFFDNSVANLATILTFQSL
jgi:hypothetical protein